MGELLVQNGAEFLILIPFERGLISKCFQNVHCQLILQKLQCATAQTSQLN